MVSHAHGLRRREWISSPIDTQKMAVCLQLRQNLETLRTPIPPVFFWTTSPVTSGPPSVEGENRHTSFFCIPQLKITPMNLLSSLKWFKLIQDTKGMNNFNGNNFVYHSLFLFGCAVQLLNQTQTCIGAAQGVSLGLSESLITKQLCRQTSAPCYCWWSL